MTESIYEKLSAGLIDRLLTMRRKTRDRDIDDGWLPCENFGEFYAQHRHLLAVRFSHPDRLVARVIEMYVLFMLGPLVRRLGVEGDYAVWSEVVRLSVGSNFGMLSETLQRVWPDEHADIVQRNETPGLL